MTEMHIFYNLTGEKMAAGSVHFERTSLHGREVDTEHVVVAIEEVFTNGCSLYPDPIEGEYSLYVGMFSLWRKDLVDISHMPAKDHPEVLSTHGTTTNPLLVISAEVPLTPEASTDVVTGGLATEVTATSTIKAPLNVSARTAVIDGSSDIEVVEVETATG